MSVGLLLALVFGSHGVHPICTRENFQAALGTSIQGDHAFIAKSVFDDYLEDVRAIDTEFEDDNNPSPDGMLAQRLGIETKADNLFDEMLSSLSVLNDESDWNIGIANLRRTVLLEARNSTNPWPATVWVDVPSLVPVPNSVVLQIDTFLKENIDADRTERFMASVLSNSNSDIDRCREYEKKAMQRWSEYIKIITPYINGSVESALFPQLNRSDGVQKVINWINENIDDGTVVGKVTKQIALWSAVNKKQKQAIVQLVTNARVRLGFDPWSRGCGQQINSSAYKIKIDLLQKSAELQEFDDSVIKSLLGLLTSEQRQLFEDEK